MDDEKVDEGKRNFLKAMVVLSAGVAAGGAVKTVIQNITTPKKGLAAFPNLQLYWVPPGASSAAPIPINLLKQQFPVNSTNIWLFYYPLTNDPNFLLNLGDSSGNPLNIKPVQVSIPATGKTFQSPGGVGPDNSIVSYSAICQHLGCVPPIIHYYTPGSSIPGQPENSGANNPGYIHCNCHGSTYDPLKGAAVVHGPTARPLPNTVLNYDSTTGELFVVSMVGPTIYGKTSDLTGGTPFPDGTKHVEVQNTGTATS